eukprot:TRINITY_DN15025_c0_g1_i1.p1 TRINITY_DN15025_c0_g1~~TRINITY_DN15025_c0_g1_i1.p1  ORF type:complete len:110 (-),score=16.07 TRINITY_DN15025_c0_g1_i1:86-415(-)
MNVLKLIGKTSNKLKTASKPTINQSYNLFSFLLIKRSASTMNPQTNSVSYKETQGQGSQEAKNIKQDPQDREVQTEAEIREKNFDKTNADSFPTSDPPSSIPDPKYEES